MDTDGGCLWGENKNSTQLSQNRPRQQWGPLAEGTRTVGWNERCRGTGLAAERPGPSPAGDATLTHFSPPRSVSFHSHSQIKSRSMRHIPAPLNQCHVHSFALKKKKKIIGNRRAAAFPESALFFIVRGRIMRSLQR